MLSSRVRPCWLTANAATHFATPSQLCWADVNFSQHLMGSLLTENCVFLICLNGWHSQSDEKSPFKKARLGIDSDKGSDEQLKSPRKLEQLESCTNDRFHRRSGIVSFLGDVEVVIIQYYIVRNMLPIQKCFVSCSVIANSSSSAKMV